MTLEVTYRITGDDPAKVADAIRVEQTIEFPLELVDRAFIRDVVVGQVTGSRPAGDAVGGQLVTIAYDDGVVGGELPQLLNVLWGNVSMLPGVRVEEVVLPESLLVSFPGPRFGVAGLRALLDAPARPLLTTAIKPMGLSAAELGVLTGVLAEAGLDIVKDDHSLANQPWAPFRERVARCSEAVASANGRTGGRCLYMPSLNVPAEQVLDAAHEAATLGAGALLVLPGVVGFDALRLVTSDAGPGLPVMSHPSLLGSYVVTPTQGLAHGIVLGTLMRLAGADLSVFPHHGGRFSFSAEECRAIAEACRAPLGDLAACFPAPGGGMTPERVPDLLATYGADVALLIGGALHRGDVADNARRFRAQAEELVS